MDVRRPRDAVSQEPFDHRDQEIARLKREVATLRGREESARTEAQDARKHFADLTSMSKRFAYSMRATVGERQQQRRRLAAQYAISQVLATAHDLDEAAPKIYEILGERLGWHAGALWKVDYDSGPPVLRQAGYWRSQDSPSDSLKVAEGTVFRHREGLPGRVWERGEPVWVEDILEDGDIPHKGAAAEDGLRGALAFPITDGRFVGVFELFHREVLLPDENLMRTAALVGGQISHFLERRHAEEERDLALAREREARERVSGILESINDAFFALDGERRFTYVNNRAERFWDKTREELLGKGMWEVFPEAVGTEPHRVIEGALREGEAGEFEDISPVNDTWISARVYPSPGGLSVLFHSIDERKRAEEALRESEERYRSLADATSSIVWAGNRSGAIVEEIPGWEEFTGQTFEEYRGFGWLNALHPEDRPPEDLWEEMMASNPVPIEEEYRLGRRDGEYRRVVMRGVPILEEGGGTREWVGTMIDVEERRRAEEEREELRRETEWERARLETILRQMPGGVFIAEPSGRFVLANEGARRIYGKEVGSVEECESLPHSYPDGGERPPEGWPLTRALDGEIVSGMEYYVRRPDGTQRIVRANSAPVWDERGNVVAAVKVFEDVTRNKEAESERDRSREREREAREAAEEAERRLAFYAGAREERQIISRELHDRVAHSIAVVRQNLELYEVLRDRNPQAAAKKMELAKEEAKASLKSTRDLSMMLRRSEVEEGLTKALASLEESTIPMGVCYESVVTGDESLVPPHIGNQIFLVLREAVRNAVNHSGCEHVAVNLEITKERVFGTVEDDGRGFEPEEARAGGGLRSMEERASLVGGTFRIRSAPGGGARIEVTVPLPGKDVRW